MPSDGLVFGDIRTFPACPLESFVEYKYNPEDIIDNRFGIRRILTDSESQLMDTDPVSTDVFVVPGARILCGSSIRNVVGMSVYYWKPLEREYGIRGRPLLIKILTQEDGGNIHATFYQNTGYRKTDNIWKKTFRCYYPDSLQRELDHLNCRLNKTTIIDISMEEGFYDNCTGYYERCDFETEHGKRMKVEKDRFVNDWLRKFTIFKHSLSSNKMVKTSCMDTFHIALLRNQHGLINLPQLPTPILDVACVTLFCYFSTPLLLIVEFKDQKIEPKWFGTSDLRSLEWRVVQPLSSDPTNRVVIRDIMEMLAMQCEPVYQMNKWALMRLDKVGMIPVAATNDAEQSDAEGVANSPFGE